MIAGGRKYVLNRCWMTTVPGAAILLAVAISSAARGNQAPGRRHSARWQATMESPTRRQSGTRK
jgi:hypothetical protein